MLAFPQYVITWVIKPVIISIICYILGFTFLKLVHIEYVLYAIIGLVLFLANGILIGLLFLIRKMKSDMFQVVNYSLDILQSATKDLEKISHKINEENKKEVLALLFKGIMHIITIPIVSKVISKGVPLIGKFIAGITKKILTAVANKIKFDEIRLKEELKKTENETEVIGEYAISIKNTSADLVKLMSFTFGVASFPLRLIFVITMSLLLLFIYLIN